MGSTCRGQLVHLIFYLLLYFLYLISHILRLFSSTCCTKAQVASGSRKPNSQIRFTTICPHEVRDERQLTLLSTIALRVVANNRHPCLEQHSTRERAVPREAHPNQRVLVQFDLLERRAVCETHGAQVGDVCVVDGLGAVDEGPARDGGAAPAVERERVCGEPTRFEGEVDEDGRFGLER